MGNEQSNTTRYNPNNRSHPPPRPPPPQTSPDAVKRLLETQRLQYERKLQEVIAKTSAQTSAYERKLREMVAKTAAQTSAHERKLEEVVAKTAAQNSAHERKLQEVLAKTAALNSTHESKIQKVDTETATLNSTHESKLQKVDAKTAALNSTHESKIQKVDAKTAALNSTHESKLQKVDAKTAALNSTHESKLQKVDAKTAALNCTHESKLQKVDAKTATLNSTHESKIQKVDTETATLNSTHETKLQKGDPTTAALNCTQMTQATMSGERDRTPYSYKGNQLQQIAASTPPAPVPEPASAPVPAPYKPVLPVYPNLKQTPSSSANVHNNKNKPFRRPPSQDLAFVNNYGETQSYRPPGREPWAPPAPRGPAQRPRSLSRSRNDPKENAMLECPTCGTRFGMKIFQCNNGHSSCNECKIRGRECGICRGVLTNWRNYDLENHIAQQSPSSSPNVHYDYNQNNNNPFRRQHPQDLAFVNNYGETQRSRNDPRENAMLDCPTCDTRFGMKIFQCNNGHSSCNECKIRGRECGICRGVLTNRRNYDLENHIAQQSPSRSPNVHYDYNQNNNNPFRRQHPQDLAFVNNYGETQRFRSAMLECPTCDTRFGMKIFQCNNGHSSCNECKIRGRACGICRGVLTNRRNYDLENHIAQTKVPCPHTNEGCKLFIKLADMEGHLKKCPFKEQECPLAALYGTCRWKGKLSQISSHFDNMHPSCRQADVDTEMHLTNIRNNSRQVHLVVLGVYNFLTHLKVSETDGMIYMAVQLIGTATSAMKWQYEIHVYSKRENRRKYMYTDNCCSSSDKMDDVFIAGECAVLPIWYATAFLCNEALSFKFFIKKSTEERKNFGKFQRDSEEEEGKNWRHSNDTDPKRQSRIWVNSNNLVKHLIS